MNSNIILPIEEEEKDSDKTPLPLNDTNQTKQIIPPSSPNTEESIELLKLCESKFVYNKNRYLEDKNHNKILSLYSTFKFLRTQFKLENTRKNQIGCLIKKVKTKFIKSLHEAMKFCINLYIHRLPQNFVTNIKIEYNKIYFNKTIEEIYTEFKIIPSLQELIDKKLYRKNKKELLIILMKCKLHELYQYYLVSDYFKYNYKNIKRKEGEKIAKLFDFTAHNICQYFLLNKGNKKKVRKNINSNYKLITKEVKFISINNKCSCTNSKPNSIKTKFTVNKK